MVHYGMAKVLSHQVRWLSGRSGIDASHIVMHRHAIMARKKVSTTIYITPEQSEQLKLLHDKTKVPVAEYIRQGIDLVLEKQKHNLPGQLTLSVPSGK
jgi:hypothetical protein